VLKVPRVFKVKNVSQLISFPISSSDDLPAEAGLAFNHKKKI